MENEIMEMENMEMNVDMDSTEVIVMDPEVADESNGKIIFGVAVAVITTIATGVAVYLHKTKDKREAKTVEKLRKKGYYIEEPSKPIEVEDRCVDVEYDEEK